MIDNTINDAKTVAGGKGTVLAGRYQILRRLGQGGMGSVWLAEDRQLDNRKVAIKMLPTIIVQDKRAYQQLKGEALVSLKLIHPNIVTLRAFEENNGAPFLVMDYVEGQTLSDYLAVKGKLSEKETVALLKPIAAALDYAHSEKVIHRDVKPSNIIIRKDGHPFILDFGIAREIQESMTRVTGRTISGTLLYMSPEQLRGAPPAPAQDVYSFAAMAYECLKGEPPFTRGEIAYQILNEKPLPLAGRTHFVVSIMAGLAKKPKDRPKTCAEVLEKNTTRKGARTRTLTTSQGDEIIRVEDKVSNGIGGKIYQKRVIIGMVVAFLVACACGVWWRLCRRSTREAELAMTEWKQRIRRGADVADNGHTKVQLWEGGPYWADTNIGAEKPWESGYFFWWGDTIGCKRAYRAWVPNDRSCHNFIFLGWNSSIANAYNKYISSLKSDGWITADGALSPEHDAAHVHWGGRWRIPTNRELAGLVNKCNWTWAIMNGVNGYVVRGKGAYASESVFLPAAGFGSGALLEQSGSLGRYWSSVPSPDGEGSLLLDFDSNDFRIYFTFRYQGHVVRPVQDFTPEKTCLKTSAEKNLVLKKIKQEKILDLKTSTEKNLFLRHGDTKTLTLPGGAAMEMIYVSPGTFMMGSPESEHDGYPNYNEEQHQVTISKGFWLGKYEVTQEQWQSVMGNNPSRFKGSRNPVEQVSWNDCKTFCEKVNAQFNNGARLPTEAEWEYACRAGTTTAYSWGNSFDGDKANCKGYHQCGTMQMGRSLERTTQVGSYNANPWGFYDMHGNVFEWCEDKHDKNKYLSSNFRVLRGGSLHCSEYMCRSAYRTGRNPYYSTDEFGFRLCCDRMP